MNRIIDLEPGYQITVTSDERTEGLWLQVCANRGSLGVRLTPKDAVALKRALHDAIYKPTEMVADRLKMSKRTGQ